MMQAVRNYLVFLWRCGRIAFVGDWRYYAWMGALTVFCLLGLNAYAKQFANGLIVTGMSDEVSWGVYIANFTFLVGVAAAAVMMVIPVYIYNNEELHDLVIFGELLAVAAILMCLAFVTVDLGRPDRFWHLIPGIGQFNFPASMLSWDVIVLNGYLLLNVHICGYLLYCRYRGRKPAKWFYIPFVFIAIVWAVSIHTVTAFLYVGLGGRPFWNSAIVGPRFLASAFTAGPALIILAMQVVRRVTASAPAAWPRPVWRRMQAAAQPQSRAADAWRFGSAGSSPARTGIGPAGGAPQASWRARWSWKWRAGDVLLRQGETDRTAFFVLKGRVVVKREESGRFRVTRSLGPGEQFGEISALAGTPRTATAIAEEPSLVLRLPADSLRKLMSHPEDEQDHPLAHVRAAHDHGPRADDPARHRAGLHAHQRVPAGERGIQGILLRQPARRLRQISLRRACTAITRWCPGSGRPSRFNLAAMVLLVLPVSRSLKWLNRDLRAVHRRHLDRKGHGPGHPRVHSHAAGRDRRIPPFAE